MYSLFRFQDGQVRKSRPSSEFPESLFEQPDCCGERVVLWEWTLFRALIAYLERLDNSLQPVRSRQFPLKAALSELQICE